MIQLSDYNAITFHLMKTASVGPRPISARRQYNTRKADWSHFCQALREKHDLFAMLAEQVATLNCHQSECHIKTLMESVEAK